MITKKAPTVSVILPVFNAERYLKYAVDSILDQTYKNFELIIVNDGSTDGSRALIEAYAKSDDRIVAIHQENIGLVATLNKAVKLAKGTYVARMDADDISLPRRLELQVALMDKNKKAVLCASCFDVINEHNEFVRLSTAPAFNEDLKRSMHLYNPIAHGSVMFRTEAFIKAGGYSSEVGPVEDYDLWIRLASIGDFIYSPHSLFRWRMNPEGITHTNNDVMQNATRVLVKDYRKSDPIKPYRVRKMIELGKKYIDEYGAIGVIMKEIILEDNYNLGIKAFKAGDIISGIGFVVSVAFTGRTGMAIVLNRTLTYTLQKIKSLIKR